MNIEQQKQTAKKVLSKIKALDSRAIIAGGAARDWYFNNLANDIDIFYFHEEGKYCLDNIRRETAILKALLGVSNIDVVGFNSGKDSSEPQDDFNNYLKNPDIVNVFECVIDEVKFQFIQLKKQNVNVSTFAYNMCQAWSNGEWIEAYLDDEVDENQGNHVLTMIQQHNYQEKVKEYVEQKGWQMRW